MNHKRLMLRQNNLKLMKLGHLHIFFSFIVTYFVCNAMCNEVLIENQFKKSCRNIEKEKNLGT